MDLRRPPFAVITVGGTNGKGSAVAMCDAMLRAGGYRAGAYTSPHLIRYNERVAVAGRLVTDEELVAAFERVEAARGDVRLTYFEYGTIAALDIFCTQKVEIAVLEVGLGGRLDAVNAVDPDVAIVTSIGIDHTSWLGPDRESIGREKAGIFRNGRPAVCGDPQPPASLIDVAARIGARLYVAGRDFQVTAAEAGWTLYFGGRVRSGLTFPALRGDYQLRNAAAAIVALETLADRFPLAQGHMRQGLLAADIPGRFQVVPGTPPTILDVAHNVQAAAAFAENLQRHRVLGKTHAVFGMLVDKDIVEVARMVSGHVDHWYAIPISEPRGATAAQVADAIAQAGARGSITQHADAVAGYEAARAAAAPPDRIVVFGSFYTVGDILAHLNAGRA